MSDMKSARVPATMIVTGLLLIILLSSSRTTYTLATPPSGYSLAGRESRTVLLRPAPEPARACAWPQRGQERWEHDWAKQNDARPDRADLF